jgi:hypothetical protein
MRGDSAVRLRPVGPDLDGEVDLPRPIFDTPSTDQARTRPASVLADYRHRANDVWLSDAARRIADRLADALAAKQGPVWATLVGPFGFGKSATATAF